MLDAKACMDAAPRADPAISVIIAAFNAEDFIHTAIESALAQAEPDLALEVIVVDDASTDRTATLADAFAGRSESVRVVRLEVNGGPSAARNAGLDVARGEWVAVLDADDAFFPGGLRTLREAGERCGADVLLSNIVFYDQTTGELADSGLTLPTSEVAWTAPAYVRAAQPLTGQLDLGLLKPIFRRRFMEEQKLRYPVSSRHGEDFLLITDALRRGAKLFVSAYSGYRYTARNSGWSRTRIDYSSQVDQAEELIRQPDVASDPALVAALRSRIDALRRWEARLFVKSCRQRRDYGSIAQASLRSGPVRREIARLAIGKVRRLAAAKER